MSSAADRGRTAEPTPLDIRERGAGGQLADRRLFIQLQVFSGPADPATLAGALDRHGVEGVLYADVNDPRGVGVLAMSEEPGGLVTGVRGALAGPAFAELVPRPALAMLGRTYSTGYERQLEDWLLRRPRRVLMDPAWPWAIWYPLRRTGSFARLPREEQSALLREHGDLGHRYGEAGLAQDIRLACHGLDTHDNDFVIGLVGRDLYPLSHLVQAMRRTAQTSQYLERLGPFFVGHAIWRSGAR